MYILPVALLGMLGIPAANRLTSLRPSVFTGGSCPEPRRLGLPCVPSLINLQSNKTNLKCNLNYFCIQKYYVSETIMCLANCWISKWCNFSIWNINKIPYRITKSSIYYKFLGIIYTLIPEHNYIYFEMILCVYFRYKVKCRTNLVSSNAFSIRSDVLKRDIRSININ